MDNDLALSDAIDPAFLESTVLEAALLMRAEASAFYLCDPAEGRITLAATHNLSGTPWDGELLERVCASRATVIERWPDAESLIAVPAIWRDAVRGILIVADESPDWATEETGVAQAALLQPLADLTAAVLHQAERLARMTAQFRALHVIDLALTASLQLDRVLSLILEKAVSLVGAEHGSLRLLDPESEELVLKAHLGEGWTPEIRAYRFQLGHGITGWVGAHHRPYLCADALHDPQNVVLFPEMRSGVAVPLLVRAEGSEGSDTPPPADASSLLGVLLLESTRRDAFDHQDVELLEALAQEAVIAIQNATQHQKLQLMHQSLQDEQERRVAAEKWTVMGQAATALAHRINNLIGIVPASAGEVRRVLEGLEMLPEDRSWVEANLDRIERNGRYILSLSDALFRPFQETGPRARFDVNRLLKEALQAASLPAGVQVVHDLGRDLSSVESNSLLVDVFLELITNAGKAMAESPTRRLDLRSRRELDETGYWVIVEVSDTGPGIRPQQMDHLWDMFKGSAGGLGFGLWWVRTFIEGEGGTIACESTPSEGTTFTVRLPAQPSVEVLVP